MIESSGQHLLNHRYVIGFFRQPEFRAERGIKVLPKAGSYLIFATSFESIKKTIDLIKTKELENQIGQLFIIGFEGKSLTP